MTLLTPGYKTWPVVRSSWSDWSAKRWWSRFFCLSVYVTMYLNDHQRSAFYESLGLDTTQFNRRAPPHAVPCAAQGNALSVSSGTGCRAPTVRQDMRAKGFVSSVTELGCKQGRSQPEQVLAA